MISFLNRLLIVAMLGTLIGGSSGRLDLAKIVARLGLLGNLRGEGIHWS
jgi:hypothetical protein